MLLDYVSLLMLTVRLIVSINNRAYNLLGGCSKAKLILMEIKYILL